MTERSIIDEHRRAWRQAAREDRHVTHWLMTAEAVDRLRYEMRDQMLYRTKEEEQPKYMGLPIYLWGDPDDPAGFALRDGEPPDEAREQELKRQLLATKVSGPGAPDPRRARQARGAQAAGPAAVPEHPRRPDGTAMSDDLRKATQALLDHQRAMQALMRRYLKPDGGMTADQFAAEIIELLDGRAQREATTLAETAIARRNMHSIQANPPK